jgi:hypothetical protein|uniref:Putative RNA-directed DNA polymerase n=1 Tax=Sipha flava TaxID=143950 RepID=A0A2S2R690_9HEMI
MVDLSRIKDLFNHFFVNEQHGFCRAKSRSTIALIFYSYLAETVASGGQVDAIYTDLHKAFDKVDHGLLLAKLHKLDLRYPVLSWFSSYLSKRSQLIQIGNSISNIINVTSRVPQGGRLSPLIFLLFINDLNKCFNTYNFLLFADDMKLYMSNRSDEDTISLQHDLDQFSLWCSLNGIFLNTSKCVHISFNRSKFHINSLYKWRPS